MRAIVVSADAGSAELAADTLWSLGVVAVEERPGADGTVELWTSLGEGADALESLAVAVGGRWPWRTVEVDDRVVDTWRAYAEPVDIDGDVLVLPAWQDVGDELDPAGRVVLSIEPGSTFGLGDHPTTRSCLRALRREVVRRPGGAVLDVGCGSGVLAIAAVRFGAERATAIDISPAAVPITSDNARRNGVEAAVSVSTTALRDVAGTFDVVVANILAPTLVELADDLKAHLAEGGALIISGVLVGRYHHVEAALGPLRCSHVDELDGWATVTLERDRTPA